MNIRRLSAAILLLSIGCQRASISQEKPAEQPPTAAVTPAEPDTQLQLYKEALTSKGSTDQMRTNAANLLLFSNNPAAREILLAVLNQPENSAARVAVCRTLIKARTEQRAIDKTEDFAVPLLDMLRTEQEFAAARLAAEAILIFSYGKIAEPLETIAADATIPARARLNAVYALRLQPDKRAVLKLLDLVDDPNQQVAAASDRALKALGVPTGTTPENRSQIKYELKAQTQEQFLRDRLIKQGAEIRGLESEVALWKKQYLDALDKVYDAITGNAAKGKFLAEHLGSTEKIVKMWALDKSSQLRVGTAKLPDELGPALVGLISYSDRDVRLGTAKLLSLMGELNAAEKLLEQLQTEPDKEVRLELFVALGAACYYGLLPDSTVKISLDIRKKALEWAAEYLADPDPRKAQEGAEVMRKLLGQNGLAQPEVVRYLGLLTERYGREKGNPDGVLRGRFLGTMAGLCAPSSICRVEAAKLFGALFEEALTDKASQVREAAVDGLTYVDRIRAFLRFRGTELASDPSVEIRKKVINLAGEVGGKEDLSWLWDRLGASPETDAAWEAMLKIFKRAETAVLIEWLAKTDTPNAAKLSDAQKLTLLEITDQKAAGDNNPEALRLITGKLASLYRSTGKLEQAAVYFGKLHETARTPEEREAVVPNLLDVYLRLANVERAAKLIDNCLLGKDLEPNSPVVLSIERYLNEPPAGIDPNKVAEQVFGRVKRMENRPKWQQQLRIWADRIGRSEESTKPKPG